MAKNQHLEWSSIHSHFQQELTKTSQIDENLFALKTQNKETMKEKIAKCVPNKTEVSAYIFFKS